MRGLSLSLTRCALIDQQVWNGPEAISYGLSFFLSVFAVRVRRRERGVSENPFPISFALSFHDTRTGEKIERMEETPIFHIFERIKRKIRPLSVNGCRERERLKTDSNRLASLRHASNRIIKIS